MKLYKGIKHGKTIDRDDERLINEKYIWLIEMPITWTIADNFIDLISKWSDTTGALAMN